MSINTVMLNTLAPLLLSSGGLGITATDHCGQIEQAFRHYDLGSRSTCTIERETAGRYCGWLKYQTVEQLRSIIYRTHYMDIKSPSLRDKQNARFNIRLYFAMRNYCPTRLNEF